MTSRDMGALIHATVAHHALITNTAFTVNALEELEEVLGVPVVWIMAVGSAPHLCLLSTTESRPDYDAPYTLYLMQHHIREAVLKGTIGSSKCDVRTAIKRAQRVVCCEPSGNPIYVRELSDPLVWVDSVAARCRAEQNIQPWQASRLSVKVGP